MKSRLRPFEYMAWAKSVPPGARYDLTASGIADHLGGDEGTADAPWSGSLTIGELSRRSAQTETFDAYLTAIANRYGVEPSHVTPTLGASQAIIQALFALVRAGDHVIVERPTYEPLHRVPDLLGASVSRLERKFEEGWAPLPDRLAQLLTPRTRAVILSNLHNPSGVATDTQTLKAVGDMAARVGAMVLVDEVYLDYAFDPNGETHPWKPACVALDNGVSWSSATKCFGFSAIRAGWIVTRDESAARAMRTSSDFFHVDVPLASARLGTLVLDQAEALTNGAMTAITRGRAIIDDWMASESRVSWVPPSAGASGLVKLPALMQDTVFADRLREEYDTAVVPGSMFDASGFVRVSFAGDPADLQAGLSRFSSTLDDLG